MSRPSLASFIVAVIIVIGILTGAFAGGILLGQTTVKSTSSSGGGGGGGDRYHNGVRYQMASFRLGISPLIPLFSSVPSPV